MVFHPVVSTWFEKRFGEATEPQLQSWPFIKAGRNVLISAPTGSGKTLAAFLSAIDALVRAGLNGELDQRTRVLYVSPLKALANDIQQNLLEPLEEIRVVALEQGYVLPDIRPLVRTGDTTAAERRKMLTQHPHILVTTPESLYILLTSAGGKRLLETVDTAIVDEIHSLARDKRGSHLALTLERLDHLVGRPLQRIGLSATQKPITEIGQFLVGTGREVSIVDVGHRRQMDLLVEVPSSELGAVASHEMWEEVNLRLVELIQEHQATLIFVNTRRMAERTVHRLAELLGPDQVGAHHGSLAKETRLAVEKRLKKGEIRAVVATASLELGIDIGSVDLVCQLGSTRSISLALQRVGRSGHWKGATPKGRIFATTRDELLECAALVRGIRSGKLDQIHIPVAPLDILAQQIVAAAVGQDWDEEELFRLLVRAQPFSSLSEASFSRLIRMLSEGIATSRGRRSAYLHWDRVNRRIRARRGARLAALISGGAIPDNANYVVKVMPEDVVVGDVDEDFAVESISGDVFVLGNTAWRIQRIEAGVVRVEDARGATPNIPFWNGEAPGRTDEVSVELSRVREQIRELGGRDAEDWLQKECCLTLLAARQAADYVKKGYKSLGAVPTCRQIIAERFFDESGGMQLVLHAPFGSRINKAWGLALRKRFCRSFDFELQAAATDNGILLSLSDQHSFPLDSVFSFLSPETVRKTLIQALLPVPLFGVRWRWTATRALAILRFAGGRKVPPHLQRMRSDDLLAAVFPEQAACQEHIVGDIEMPDHPLLEETLRDCLTQAFDIDGLQELLSRIERGEVRCLARDTREPSPFCHEVINANPYAYLDNAPLAERRTRAVQVRRTLPVEVEDLGALDVDAIERVVQESQPPLRSPDEVHDALLSLGVVPEEALKGVSDWVSQLVTENRVYRLVPDGESRKAFLVAAERLLLVEKIYPVFRLEPRPGKETTGDVQWERDSELSSETALVELVRNWMATEGPLTARDLAATLSLQVDRIEGTLSRLEAEGQVLRGSFRPSVVELEWCDRRLLARIHRLTLKRLRSEIEPAAPADFMRFLFRWQHLAPGTQLFGVDGTAAVLERLQGYESAAAAWESALLPSRVSDYQPQFLDQLCLSGQFGWGRISSVIGFGEPGKEAERKVRPTRLAPVAFFRRENADVFLRGLREEVPTEIQETLTLSHSGREVLEHLERRGASFFQDLVRSVGRLPVEVESGLWELVAAGLVSADGFANLRALIDPQLRQAGNRNPRRRLRRLQNLSTGRWTLLREIPEDLRAAEEGKTLGANGLEFLAFQLLQRWGVFFKDLLLRESVSVVWRDLLMVLRRLEAQGRIRGGRFVTGCAGEQFALPEAVDALRTVRRTPPDGQILKISAADPLNLVGIVLPGPRIRPNPDVVVRFRDGVPIDSQPHLV